MPLIKAIWVKLSETGAAEVRDKLDDVAKRAEAVSKIDPEIKVSVDDKAGLLKLKALRVELSALQARGGDPAGFRNLANQLRDIGNNADGARLRTAALGLELRAIRDLAAGDQGGGGKGGGFFGNIFGGLWRTKIPLGPLGSAPVPVVAGAGAGLLPPVLGILPELAAAAAGVGAFGALAYPTFSKVSAAVGLTGDKLKDLPKGLRGAVTAVQGVMKTFDGLSKIFAPSVFKIIKDLAPGIKQLIGDMGPFAHAVAPVLDQLAKSFTKFTMSPGFKAFLDQMLKLSPGAVAAIGKGVGQLAIAFGKLLQALVSPAGLTALKVVFTVLRGIVASVGILVPALTVFDNLMLSHFRSFVGNFLGQGHILSGWFDTAKGWAVGLYHAWLSAWDWTMGVISKAGDFIGRVLTTTIPDAGAKLLTWFANLPSAIVSSLASAPSQLFGSGQSIISGLWGGMKSVWSSVTGWLGSLGGIIRSLKGPLEKDKVLLVPAGMAIMQGLQDGLKRGSRGVFDLAADIGVHISDRLMDAFTSRNDKWSDRAGRQIAVLLRNRIEQIRQFVLGIRAQEVAWASITSAATGPAFAPNPRWIHGHNVPGTGGIFSHIGSGTGAPGHHVAGHWAGGVRPVSAVRLLHNMRLDLGRLRQFGVVLGKLRRMGLDNTLIQQIIAAGPDQGFQIAEAILDAGRHEVHALDRTERGIQRAGLSIGKTAARSQFGNGVTVIVNVRGLMLGDARQFAREIQKILAELKRHNGGAALGLS